MDYNKIEDAVFKKAMEFFKDNAAKFFGINTKIVAPADTEIKNIEINHHLRCCNINDFRRRFRL
jgi:hypothetical protein